MSSTSHRLDDLILAIAANSIDIAEDIVCSPGFDVNRLSSRGLPPLLIASAYGRGEIVKLLISRRSNIHQQIQGTGLTALHVASSNGFADVVNLLISSGADIHKRDSSGATALNYAEISPQPLELTSVSQEKIDKGDESLITMRHECIRILEKT